MFRNYLMRACAASLLLAASVALAPISALAQQAIVDGSGREVQVKDISRILSVGGDITEILYALRADDKIIAIDSTSQFPGDALQKKTDVGYLRALSAEGVLSTNPSVIIASADAGPPPVVAVLKSSSVPYVVVPDDKTPEGVANKIRFVAKVVGMEAAGEALAKDVERDFALLAEQRAKISKPKRALFVLSVQSGKATIGGAGTGADAMIKLAGAINAGAAVPGYKPMTDEAGVELAPDAILTMQHGPGGMPSDRMKTVASLAGSPAMKNGEIIEMNGLYLLGFGPRCARAARELMAALYPELAQNQKKASASE